MGLVTAESLQHSAGREQDYYEKQVCTEKSLFYQSLTHLLGTEKICGLMPNSIFHVSVGIHESASLSLNFLGLIRRELQ